MSTFLKAHGVTYVIVSVCRAEKLFCVGAQSKAMDVSTGTSDSEE